MTISAIHTLHASASNSNTYWNTSRLDEANTHLNNIFWPHELNIIDSERSIQVQHVSARLASLSINSLSYGADVSVRPVEPVEAAYVFVFTLAGVAQHREENEVNVSRADDVYVTNPGVNSQTDISYDHTQLSLKLSKSIICRYLEQEFNIDIKDLPRFSTRTTSIRNDTKSLGYVLKMITSYLNDNGEQNINPIVEAHLEKALISAIITELPHNYSALVNKLSHDETSPRYVRIAQEYIHANIYDVITIDMLSKVAHSNPRSIQTGFKKSFEMTPTQYIRSYRLDIAHEKLKRAAVSGLSVAEIANSCGFNDLSKFARYYRAKFGQLPSTTIR